MVPISQSRFRRRLTRVITLPIVLLLSLAGISVWQTARLLTALQWVDHTDQVIAEANWTQKLLLDQETGLRGYLLTGDLKFLEPYQQANQVTDTTLNDLKQLVSDNPQQVQRVIQIEVLYQKWHQLLLPALTRKRQGVAEPRSLLVARKQQMDAIRAQITAFIAVEEQLRDQRSQTAQLTTERVVLTSILLAIVIGAILAYFIWQQLRQVSGIYEGALETAQEQTATVQRSAHRLAELHRIDRAILAAQSIESLAQETLSHLTEFNPKRQAAIILSNGEAKQARLLASEPAEETVRSISSLRTRLSANQPNEQEPLLYIADIATLEERPPTLETLLAQGYRSFLAVAMKVEESHIGDLTLFDPSPNAFSSEDQAIAKEIGAQLAIAIHQSRLQLQLKQYANELEQRVQKRTIQLETANEDLEAFAYSVSHDLRAPLRTLQGFAQALLEDYGDRLNTSGKEYIRFISEGALQMDTLITDLLAYSHVSRAQIQLQNVDLNAVVDTALRQLSTQLQEQQTEVTIDPPLPIVVGHRLTLIQAVINLLNNALKFVQADQQPKIHIFAEEDVQGGQIWVRLWIEDNGIGIASEHQERIFHVFERLHGAETYPGTGIGLAIVRKGLERMGGRIGVESQLGQGSRFWIALPKAVLPPNSSIDDSNNPKSSLTRRG